MSADQHPTLHYNHNSETLASNWSAFITKAADNLMSLHSYATVAKIQRLEIRSRFQRRNSARRLSADISRAPNSIT